MMLRIFSLCIAGMFGSLLGTMCVALAQEPKTVASPKSPVQEEGWKPLLKPDSLDGWKLTNFGGEGVATVDGDELRLERGNPLTGITLERDDFPREDYELRWQAQRIDGSDFFAGVTFPVGKEYLTFICGGWGGGLVGLSSINGNDASENETASYMQFKNKKWYSFRVRVDATQVTVWIDDEQKIQVERGKKKFSLRAEVLKSRPLGYCGFQSDVLVKGWEYRTLADERKESK